MKNIINLIKLKFVIHAENKQSTLAEIYQLVTISVL